MTPAFRPSIRRENDTLVVSIEPGDETDAALLSILQMFRPTLTQVRITGEARIELEDGAFPPIAVTVQPKVEDG